MNLIINTEYETSYICEIEENGGIIKWQYTKDSRPDCVLLVSTSFGKKMDLNNIIELIHNNDIKLVENVFIDIDDTISCKLITNIQGKVGVYNAHKVPATYCVYGCVMRDDDICVFDEFEKKHNHCNVSCVIEYRIENAPIVKTTGGLFNRTKNQYNFSKISVCSNKDYIDGAACYFFEDMEIKFPISKKMLCNDFFIRWFNNEKPPIVRANIDGYVTKRV